MSKVVAIITDPAIGGTFLSWTIEYLAGHNYIYNAFAHLPEKLVSNPVINNNAHLHNMNHFSSKYTSSENVRLLPNVISELQRNTINDFHIIYTHMHSFMQHIKDGDRLWDYSAFCNFTNIINLQNITTIFVHVPKKYVLYFDQLISRATNTSEIDEYLIKNCSGILNQNNLDLLNVYDKRELIALSINPYNYDRYNATKSLINDKAYLILAPELWLTLDDSIFEIMKFLNVDVNMQRYEQWVNVYKQWKPFHIKRMQWCWYIDDIIESILNGYDMNLERFKLDLYQEATIQHILIYQHGLNLKTYELYKFENTKQLYNRLVQNEHDLSKSMIQ